MIILGRQTVNVLPAREKVSCSGERIRILLLER